MKISIGLVLALSVACLAAGCISEANYCATWVHQCWTTNKAWRCRKWMYEGIACESSFKAGFKAGYRFANCGGDSCQPPGPSHFWFANGMTEEDQREAQAWCDGFTHGTLAAQQDGNTIASALDAQTAQPPEGVPEVYYYSNASGSAPMGSPQYMGQFAPGQSAPGQDSTTPSSGGMTPYTPNEATPAPAGSPNWSAAAAPADVAYPPAAPAAETMELPTGKEGAPSSHFPGSQTLPGIGSLRTMVGPARSAPPPALPSSPVSGTAAAGTVPPPPGPPAAHAPLPYSASSSIDVSPKNASEAAPSTLPTPSIRTSPSAQWELPIIRD